MNDIGTIGKVIIGAIALAVASIFGFMFVYETNYAGWTTIVQAPFTGAMSVYQTPGTYWQGGGTATPYKRACTISFVNSDEDQNDTHDSKTLSAIPVQFNDNGTATCSGNVRFELPMDNEKMLVIHDKYRSYDHLVEALLAQHTVNVVVNTAQMFSGEQTYSGARSEFQRLAQDQLQNGVYQTEVKEIEGEDPVTHEKRRVRSVTIKYGTDGKALRVSNPLAEFGVTCPQFLPKGFKYEPSVLAQIEAQREAFQRTITARAQAQEASQAVITTRAQGEAAVIKVQYENLVTQKQREVQAETEKMVAETQANQQKSVATIEKEKAEIEGQKRLLVAELDRQAAEQTKMAQIALGEGEATRKKLVMDADGALEMKLEAYKTVNANYAQAMAQYRGAWVPHMVFGNSSNNAPGSGAQDLINLLTVKAAKDLSLDLSNTTQVQTVPASKPQ